MNAYVSKEKLVPAASKLSHPRHGVQNRASRRGPFAWIAAWLERQRAFSELAGMTDRELQDVGLIRADIGRVFEAGFTSSWS